MGVRIASAAVGLILLFLVSWSDQIVLGLAIFAVSVIGMYEFYGAMSRAGYRPLKFIGYISCVPIIFIGLNGVFKKINNYIELFKSLNYLSFLVFAFVLVMFSAMVLMCRRYNIVDVSITFTGALYVSFLFSFIVLVRNLDNPVTAVYDGFFYMWFIFIGAWSTDTFALLAGRSLGRHKLLPAVSPKKTVEGSIGGIVGCVAVNLLYGLLVNSRMGNIPFYHFLVLGVINGIISQIGDLGASAIKRFTGIKDFGKIMPGHGGILDRFDSILFIAPVVYFYINFLIL